MVLVTYRLDNPISILQTKLRDREGHEARRIGLEAVPLDQHIEGGHGERQARLKIGPAPMHHLLQMTHEREHRQHRLHQHPVLPLPALTQFQVAQFLTVCSRLKWSRHLTKSPCLTLLARAGSSAAYTIISACSNAVS